MNFTRDRIIRQTRLHHALAALSSMYFGTDAGHWEASDDGGLYLYYNGMGDHFCIAWDTESVVATAYSHESEHAEYYLDEDERDPIARLVGMPGSLDELAERAAGDVERLVTSGLWCGEAESGMAQPMDTNWADGLEQLAGFGMSPRDALFGNELLQDWSQIFSLSPAHCELALSWVETLEEKGRATVTDADVGLLLEPPIDFADVSVDSAQIAADLLAQLGVAWTVPVDQIEARNRADATDHHSEVLEQVGEQAYAFVEAAREGDLEQVSALIEAGVDLDCRTVEGQWEYVPEGDTALIQALKNEQIDVAGALIEAGADCALANCFGQTALTWAMEAGDVDIARAIVAGGADANVAAQDGTTPLHIATRDGNLALVDVLLKAGADVGAAKWNGKTPADLAEMLGYAEILSRFAAQEG